MKTKKAIPEIDHSTEEKIKNAARRIFHKKGFAATRTRDIAEEAGINLALLNYYFRSKEKLFDIIMMESLQGFFQSIATVFNNEESSWEEKIEFFVNGYIDFLAKQPDLPLFILSELQNNPGLFVSKLKMKEVLMKSHFIKQFQQQVKKGKIAPMHPLHFLMNLGGMVVFPFIASPMFKSMGDLKQADFNELMEQRKQFIPKWMKMMYKMK